MKYIDRAVIQKFSTWSLPPAYTSIQSSQGIHASIQKGKYHEYREYREYTPGDDIRNLDWNIYARTRKLMVKEFEEHKQLSFFIVLDSSQSVTEFKGPEDKFFYMKQLAATLAYLLLNQQDQVSIYSFDTTLHTILPSTRNKNHLLAAENAFDLIQGKPQTQFQQITQLIPQIRVRPPWVILISDFLAELDEIFHSLHQLHQVGCPLVLFHLLTSWELYFPLRGEMVFKEPETGRELALDTRSIGKEYMTLMEKHEQAIRSHAQEKQIAYFKFPMDTHFSNHLHLFMNLMEKR
jgi:uncharacterized protein (DUF58 family)